MDSAFLSRRRGTLIITVAILKATRNVVGRTTVMYSVGLSYSQLAKYLGFLVSRGFIEQKRGMYKTAEKGLRLIEEFESSPLTRSIVAT
jgi:predicted transcriptional regulator